MCVCVSVCVCCVFLYMFMHVFVFPTSGRKLLGVDDFGSIFLSRGDLYAPPDHRECAPEINTHREIFFDVFKKSSK